jgi:hypothetical protein
MINERGAALGRKPYGIAAVTRALEGLHFPVTKQDVLEYVGDATLHFRKGEPVELHEIVENIDKNKFATLPELLVSVARVLPEEERSRAFGIAAVTQALAGLAFLARKEEVLAEAGDVIIEFRKGHSVRLRELVEDIDREQFHAMSDLVHGIHQVLDEQEEEVPGYGIVAIMRALDGIECPISKQGLIRRAGDQRVEIRVGEPIDLRDVIELIDQEQFATIADVIRAVADVLRTTAGGEEARFT